MKYVVVEINDKQHLVQENTLLKVDSVHQEDKKTFMADKVLLLNDGETVQIGNPYLVGSKVTFEIVEDKKDKKVQVRRFRSKSRHRKNKGHRQPISILKVVSIAGATPTKPTVKKEKTK